MSSLNRLWHYASPWRRQTVVASIFSILNKLFDIAPEILIGIAVDTVVKREESFVSSLGFHSPKEQLLVLGVVTFTVWALESLTQYVQTVQWRRLAQSLQHALRLDAYAHVQRLQMAWFEQQNTGDLVTILNDDINQLERFLDGGANEIIQIVTSSLVIGAIFFYLAPSVALLSMLPIPIILWGAARFQKSLAPRYASVRQAAGTLGARLSNNLLGIATIKSFGTEELELQKLRNDSDYYRTENGKAIQLSSAFVPVIRMAVLAGFIVTLVYGGWMAFSGALAVGSYSVLVFITQRLLWPFTRLGQTVDLYQRAMASAARALDLIDTSIIVRDSPKAIALPKARGEIRFENISFSYGEKPMCQNLSLEFPAEKFAAIVGSTGSGKSTLIKLLMRFYEPHAGRVLLDGHNISDVRLRDLRQHIGFVSQDVFLFQGSIRDNIAYGTPNALLDTVIAAAKVAEAHDFITALPQGYDSQIGERGQRLSGGQKQRLAIARAVLKNPPILILDEATSAVDNETEAAIQRSLARIAVGRTTIAIAHRLSTIRHADVIYVLENGRVAETGQHPTLLAQQGIYARLWDIQTGAF
jgi:ATP-binding cassette, subfamily B, bacterial